MRNLAGALTVAAVLAAVAVFAFSDRTSGPSATTDEVQAAPASSVTTVPAVVETSTTVSPLGSTRGAETATTSMPSPSTTEVERADEVRLVVVGDIAVCGDDADGKVAALVESLDPEYVLATGDLAYPDGREESYRDCWEPIWGELEDRVRPTPGNHDYRTDDAEPYFERFGRFAPSAAQSWYRFEVGAWTVLSIDSNCQEGDRCDDESDQLRWIDEQLTDLESTCVLAFTHHPRFSSGHHGNAGRLDAMWRRLGEGDVDIVVTGHEHSYERLGPMSADDGEPSDDGLIQFVAGTGGAALRPFPTALESSRRRVVAHGALEVTLSNGAFRWSFVDIEGEIRDSGSHEC